MERNIIILPGFTYVRDFQKILDSVPLDWPIVELYCDSEPLSDLVACHPEIKENVEDYNEDLFNELQGLDSNEILHIEFERHGFQVWIYRAISNKMYQRLHEHVNYVTLSMELFRQDFVDKGPVWISLDNISLVFEYDFQLLEFIEVLDRE